MILFCSELSLLKRRRFKMKTRALVLIVLAAALSVAPQLFSAPSAAGTYSAKLISPRIGQILYPGQKIMIEWKSTLPKIDLTGSEMELFLSLDGGRTDRKSTR